MTLLVRYFLTLLVAAVGLVAGLVLLTRPAKAIAGAGHSRELPAAVELNELSQRSVVYDRNGGVLAVLHAEENRSPITLDQVPEHVINAILDVEDDHFYDHGGVNLRAILRATVANVESGEVVQGGSTITQQLVKNSLLTPERDVGRKAKEAVLAVRLENQMSKQEILEQYLNTVYFGSGAYGVQAAAETYWGVQAGELTPEQGAFLAGLIRNPVGYDPFKRPDLARSRRNYALDRMVVRGHLEPDQAEELKKVAIPAKPFDPLKSRDDYFLEEVKQRLLDDTRLGDSPTARYNALFRGGLRIETTFDPRLQDIAERKIQEKIPNTKGRFTPALVSVEPSSGAVRAMVAGDGFEDAKYNLATGRGGSGRHPGSSFKLFVLLAAMENGYGPNDIVNGSEPCPVRIKGVKPNPYEPGNYEGSKGSVGPISGATAKSLNCAFIRLGLALDENPFESLEEVADMARRMGVPIDDEFGPSISLGAEEATPLEMASAYGVLANDGIRHEPYFVERVLNRTGEEVLQGRDDGKRVIDENIARAATSVLRGVVDGGTGTKARQRDRMVAGKTGTSQEWRDAWFIGFTPQLSTAVWMGNPNKQDSMRNVGGIRVTGGSYPAAAWGAYTAEALEGQPPLKFLEPDLRTFGKTKTVKVSKEAGGGKVSTTTVPKKRKPSGRRPQSPPTTASLPSSDDGGSTSGGGSGGGGASGGGADPPPSNG